MLILIQKDDATRIPKEVTPEQAQAFAREFDVFVVNEAGDTVSYSDYAEALKVVAEEPAAPKQATKKAK